MRQKRTRGIHALMGRNNVDSFDRHKMCMDVVSWILYWGTEHREFDDSLKWIAEFLKYLLAYTTQKEEDWFDDLCNKIHADTTGRKGSHYFKCSKALSAVLRHCTRRWLFTDDGCMDISDCFQEMEWNSPKEFRISGAQFAATILCFNLHAVDLVSIQCSCNISIRRSSCSLSGSLQSSC